MRENRLLRAFRSYTQKNALISEGESVVLGVSGGADSVCLLVLFSMLQKEWDLDVHILHIHHGIRGTEADRDAAFVESVAKERGLAVSIEYADVPGEAKRRGMSEEEAGRYVRYEALERYRRQHQLDKIAVAHHRQDQTETVLFRLFRGTGPRGLAGMYPVRGTVIRPLLFADREQIEQFLRDEGIRWCEDSTNGETDYARNWLRNRLIPQVEERINAKAGEHIADLAKKMGDWNRVMDRICREFCQKAVTRDERAIYVEILPLLKEEEVLCREVLRMALSQMIPGAKDMKQSHYLAIFELMSKESGKRIHLPGEIEVIREYSRLVIQKKPEKTQLFESIECPLPCCHIIKIGTQKWKISMKVVEREDLPKKIPQKDYTKWFDYDMIKSDLTLRNPRQGDYFVVDAMGHKKKLSRHFIDKKIPCEERARQWVLAEGSHVLWSFPERMSEAYKINDKTKKILAVTKERVP